jgi:hypothetical protein
MSATYYHGGNRGLRIGDKILPPKITGRTSTSDYIANNVHRRDRIYVTPDIAAASLYASVHQEPTVYEVVPEGSLGHDPDCDQPGLSFECDKASIVRVHKVPGKIIKRARKALLTPDHR